MSDLEGVKLPVIVKPLRWQKENIDGTLWTGVAPASGQYLVKFNGREWEATRGIIAFARCDTCDEAKVSAQLDFSNRILSALSPDIPAPLAGSGETVAWRYRYKTDRTGDAWDEWLVVTVDPNDWNWAPAWHDFECQPLFASPASPDETQAVDEVEE